MAPKGKNKGKDKKGKKKSVKVASSKEPKAEDGKASSDKKDPNNNKNEKGAKGGKNAPQEGAQGGRKGRRRVDEPPEEQVYVSPFSDDPDDGFGFGDDHAADLADLEHMLNVEVDEDFFVEPRYFHTLRRVINVLGIHVTDDGKEDTGKSVLERNPAYQNLQKQAKVVEEAIEHMSRVYCNALNRSVIQVGRIAREFEDAIEKVESLRRQLRVIQDTIGARSIAKSQKSGGNAGNEDEDAAGNEVMDMTPATHMSLRELWMKKLESEALLSLIAKVNVVREAPGRFDLLTSTVGNHHTCRIGAATQCLTNALETMFSDEISQVEALSSILENLMLRKSTCEEIVWETLEDILYLRTSNGPVLKLMITTNSQQQQQQQQSQQKLAGNVTGGTGAADDATVIKDNNNKDSNNNNNNENAANVPTVFRKIYNPFHKNYQLLCVEETDDVSIDSQASGASDDEDWEEDNQNRKDATHKRATSETSFGSHSVDDEGNKKHTKRMMIPKVIIESELDLTKDELRCFDKDTKAVSKHSMLHENMQMQKRYLPRYTDPVLSVRIMVDCLLQFGQGQLAKAEKVLMPNVETEIKNIIHREQARTYYRLDRRRPTTRTIRASVKDVNELKDFRRHFTAVLSSLGCIMMRYTHFAQCARTRIMADEELRASFQNPSQFLQPVLDKAYSVMQSELKNFLRACLQVTEGRKIVAPPTELENKNETKIFSFGVLEGEEEEEKEAEEEAKPDSKQDKKQDAKQQQQQPEPEPEPKPEEETAATESPKFSEMPASTFVSTVLFPMTNTKPQVQHALVFRRSMDRFTKLNEERADQLARASGETAHAMRRKSEREELAIEFLDRAIQNDVNPVVQQNAVRGTIETSELQDAFEPPDEANVYARADKIQPLDVAMVEACEGMLDHTEPLFMAIHRLPPGGEMYETNVSVLDFLHQNMLRVVEDKVKEICDETTADELLEGYGDNKGKLSAAIGKRDAFIGLLKAYEFDMNLLDAAQLGTDGANVDSNEKESPEKANNPLARGDGLPEKGVEREEAIMKQEIDLLGDYGYLDFLPDRQESLDYDVITKGELKKATCLSHSLLKVSSILEQRLKSRVKGSNKLLEGTSELHDKIKQIKKIGIRMAKFCHVEVLLQIIYKMAPVCNSTTLCAPDAVRIPTAVNALAEYMTQTMDYLRESTSNAMAAYTFSNVGQYLPACLMSTVRVIAHGEGIIDRAPLTMQGIESLDRSAAVLYKDLKAATGFQSQFFNIELTALAFERAATFTALMEMSKEELVQYYSKQSESEEFSDDDFELMFRMDGPRRRGDDKQFKRLKAAIKQNRKEKEEKKKEAGLAATTATT
ncbi:expressed unknown protein [Seminavis robusta]|uniref:Exocyst complex component Sec8 n=1 Tax=Seminavis robusta TaxID=568900 RepID=A0A9N8EZY9_9STRA|nr:expressed unknown protein [Seminavis robusta]|eukprot:Sro2150_g316680.1 n/a (1340) ;mRNA; f:6939-11318